MRVLVVSFVAFAGCGPFLIPGVDGALGVSTDPLFYGENGATVLLEVSNLGDTDATGPITIEVTTSQGITPVASAPTDWTCTLGWPASTCTHPGVLASNGTLPDLDLNLEVLDSPAIVRDEARICTKLIVQDDVNPSNDGGCEVFPVAHVTQDYDLQVTTSIWHPIGSVLPWGAYHVVVQNLGPSPALDPIEISDLLPAPLEVEGYSYSHFGTSCAFPGAVGDPFDCTITGGLGVGQTALIHVAVSTPDTYSGTVDNCATVFAVQDLNANNDQDCISTFVDGPPPFDLGASVVVADPISVGGEGIYAWIIQHSGPNWSTPVTNEFEIPAGAALTGWISTDWTTTCFIDPLVPDVLSCMGASYDVGDTHHIALYFDGLSASSDGYAACGSVSAIGDGDPTNDVACTDDPVPATPVPSGTSVDLAASTVATAGGLFPVDVVVTPAARTSGPILTALRLPEGWMYVGSAEGADSAWRCQAATVDGTAGQNVTCIRTSAMSPGEKGGPKLVLRAGPVGVVDLCARLYPSEAETGTCVEVAVRDER